MKHDSRGPARRYEVTIEKVVYGGMGLGRHGGKVVFVPFSAPGDRLVVHTVREKRRFIEASIDRILVPGGDRVEPVCGHFGSCGGCQWQHLPYDTQVASKAQILSELLHHHLPKCRDLEITMRASPQPLAYRSRARFQLRGFLETARIGFHRFRSHEIEAIQSCPLLTPVLNEALADIAQQRRQGHGNPGACQMEVVAAPESHAWSGAALEQEPEEDVFAGLGGGSPGEPPLLDRKVADWTYAVSPTSFFQTNDFLIEELVRCVARLTEAVGNAAAIDLFAGIGLFTLPLGARFQRVSAVERSPESARLCMHNVVRAGYEHVQVMCAEVDGWMEANRELLSADLVLLDPPRQGLAPGMISKLAEQRPGTILYVSCDPQTLMRDLKRFALHGYEIDFISGFDLFPQTYHFETVVRLRRP